MRKYEKLMAFGGSMQGFIRLCKALQRDMQGPPKIPGKIYNRPPQNRHRALFPRFFASFMFPMFSYGKFAQKYPRKKSTYIGLCRTLLVGIYGYMRHPTYVKNNYWLRGFPKFPVLFLCTGVYICICLQAWPLENPWTNLQQTSPKQISGAISNVFSCFLFLMFSY